MEEVGGCLAEELMASPMGSSTPTLRKVHFLKPPKVSTFTLSGSTSLPQSSAVVPPIFDPKSGNLKVCFPSWRFYESDWKEWVNHLEPKHREVWKKAGVYSAIIGSTSTYAKDYELIMGLVEKWCTETNSFVFPWGEATLTLEGVAILGGYSVLGSPVFPKSKVKQPAEVELVKALKEVGKGANRYVNQADWIQKFKESLEDAWFNFMRPFEDTEMYMPSRLFDADVTLKYFEWWKKQSISIAAGGPPRLLDDVMHKAVWRKRTPMKRLKRTHGNGVIANANNTGDVSRGCFTNCCIINIEDSDEDDKPEAVRRVCDSKTTSRNNLSVADRDGRPHEKGCAHGQMESTGGEARESAHVIRQIGASAGTASHVIAEKNVKHLDYQDKSNGIAEVPELEINAWIAHVERDLAKIKSIVASKIEGEID